MPMSRVRLSFVTQHQAIGTADALLAAEAWSDGQPFIALNSDNLYPPPVLAWLRGSRGPAVPGFERDSLGLPIERTGAFALIERGARGCLTKIVEKPGVDAMRAAGPRALISMNIWRFDARIFDACRDVPASARGEKELPQAVGLAASRGVCVDVHPVTGAVLDLSSRSDVARVEAELAAREVRL
jgi:glucose-1-phosphate thymidylyltransferase